MTRRLYYENSHQREFQAVVLRCDATQDGYWVVLDQTAFYPTGGGQDADTGTLGGATVTDVRERENEIYHHCSSPLPVGAAVRGQLDWEPRFSRMQQHSGEHIVSGLIHSYFGYDNVGFHMGKDCMTIDFDGSLSDEDLRRVERDANRIVTRDLPVQCRIYESEGAIDLSYRSKRELIGPVRLVKIPDADLCACCGTHVNSTGEIGLILFLGREKFKGGTRVELLCGASAAEHAFVLADQCRHGSALLSVKPQELTQGISRLQQECGEQKLRIAQLTREWISVVAEKYRGAGNVLLFLPAMENSQLGKLAVAVADVCGGYCTVLSPAKDGFFFAISHRIGDARSLCRSVLDRFDGRGGGKPALVQGTVTAGRHDLECFFEEAYEA